MKKILFSEKNINLKIKSLAKKIAEDYKDKTPTLLLVANGGIDFGLDLSRELERLGVANRREIILASRYTGNERSTSNVVIQHKPNLRLKNEDLLVVEDLVHIGITLNKLDQYLTKLKPKSINYAVVGIKNGNSFRKEIKYKLFDKPFPDAWIIGYGMDDDGFQRSQKSIYIKS